MPQEYIEIRGARENNLKNIDSKRGGCLLPDPLTTKPRLPASNQWRHQGKRPWHVPWTTVLWDSNNPGASIFRGNCPSSAVLYLLWESLTGSFGRIRETMDLGSQA